MRLAVEVTTCDAQRSGVGYYAEHLVDGLLETRRPADEVVLISNRAPAPELQGRWAPHLRVSGLPVRMAWMQAEVPRILGEEGVDVAVFPNYLVPLAAPCTTIVVVHDLALLRMPDLFTRRKSLIMRTLLPWSVAAASLVATVSEASRRDLGERLGVAPGRTALLPGAAHPSCGARPPAEVAAVRERHGLDRPYVLTVGTLEPRKNLPTLLAAWDGLGAVAAERDLVIVGGRGWNDRELVRAIAARRRSGHVRWLGYVPERDLVALYAGAELFVYPSRFEGFGLPVLEAMACGAPVVASDTPALRETAGDAAEFAPPGDAVALRAAMLRVLSDEAAAHDARARGRLRAASFSWTRTAEELWRIARAAGPARVSARVRPRPPSLPPPLGDPPAGLGAREWALYATVAYADLFDAALPLAQATSACIGVELDEAELRRLATGPALAAQLTLHPSGFLTLAGREGLVARRRGDEEATRLLLDENRGVLAALAALPFVRMLAFSGGIVHQNPGSKKDIDLFVVAAAGHAYTVYTLLFLATKLTGRRRIVCPNYLVDENELVIAYHHDLFTAHQLVSARPLRGVATYLAFHRANETWARRFYPGARPHHAGSDVGWPRLQRVVERAVRPVAAPLERALRTLWRIHLRRRAATAQRPDVVLSDGIMKLHLSDYRRRVLERFASRLDGVRGRLSGAP
jgi:glycosyltransferase involved in cell wall biosynthesis